MHEGVWGRDVGARERLGLRGVDGGFHPEGYGCISLKHGVVAMIMIGMPVWVMVVMCCVLQVWWWCVCKVVPPSAHGDKGEGGVVSFC